MPSLQSAAEAAAPAVPSSATVEHASPASQPPPSQEPATTKPRRRFVGRTHPSTSNGSSSSSKPAPAAAPVSQIPADITNNATLNLAIASLLPSNYSFEVHKTIWQIRKFNVQRVALQLPEGLAMWACALCDLIEQFTDAESVVLGDVTYGACCVDDFSARAMGCDLLVHYGHSCLVPVDQTSIRTLYVFVEITVDRPHLAQTVAFNFPHCLTASSSSSKDKNGQAVISLDRQDENEAASTAKPCKLAVVGTVQFLSAVQGLASDLIALQESAFSRLALPSTSQSSADQEAAAATAALQQRKIEVYVPQTKPLSPGEVLGCTAPRLPTDTDAILYVGDGRFHLESIMLANPKVPAFRYDPYEKRLTSEGYEHQEMRRAREEAIEQGKQSIQDGKGWGVVLGTLGRQGSLQVLKNVASHLPVESTVPILLSELSPAKLSLFPQLATLVQTSCPRLSIDWGVHFPKPLLTTFEANVALGRVDWKGQGLSMDYWGDNNENGGDWTPRYQVGRQAKEREKERMARRAAKAAAAAAAAAAPSESAQM